MKGEVVTAGGRELGPSIDHDAFDPGERLREDAVSPWVKNAGGADRLRLITGGLQDRRLLLLGLVLNLEPGGFQILSLAAERFDL
jgi:hypothetical protein